MSACPLSVPSRTDAVPSALRDVVVPPVNRLAAPAITLPRHGGVACAHDCGHEFVHHVLCGTRPDLHLRHDLSKAITVESSCAPPTVACWSTANTLIFLKVAACVDITYPPGSDSIVERNTGEGKLPAPRLRLPTAPLRRPSIEVTSHEDWCFSTGLVNNIVQQADEFLVGESGRRIDAEDINSSNLRSGVEVTLPRGAPLHRHSTAHPDCRLVVGIRDPGVRWCEGPVLVGQDCHINLQLPHSLQDQVLGGLAVVEVELEDANPLLRHFAPRTNFLASGQAALNEVWVLASTPWQRRQEGTF
uniref:Uncharacterized protein n=1 Tax=Trichogramma kaykai TaxID=54128 RepID=A0ABD2W7A1_9HYME